MTQTLDLETPVQTLSVRYAAGEQYEIAVRGHTLTVDQPTDAGGADTAPTPTELFVAALAACVAFYAGRYLNRHGLGRDGLSVTVAYQMATDRPARVSVIDLKVSVPDTVSEQRRQAMLAVVQHCTVHNSLATPPAVHIELVSFGTAAR